jgi:hypothetical protein
LPSPGRDYNFIREPGCHKQPGFLFKIKIIVVNKFAKQEIKKGVVRGRYFKYLEKSP